MSEPSSVILRCKIQKEALSQFMASTVPDASYYPDWQSFDVGPGRSVSDIVNRVAGKTVWSLLAEMRNYTYDDTTWRVHFDESSNRLDIAELLVSESLSEILPMVHVLRGIGRFLLPAKPVESYLIARDYMLENRGTDILLIFENNTSVIVNPLNSEPTAEEITANGLVFFDKMSAQASLKHDQDKEYQSFDDLDKFRPVN